MNIDLIAAVMTALTMYSTFITYKYFQTKRQLRQLRTKIALQEIAAACESMADFFDGLSKQPEKKENDY